MMRAYRFYIMTGVFILFIFTMMTMTVNATESKRLQHVDSYYEEIEDNYVKVLRGELTSKGYRNAGITMTKIFSENGEREYTVKLHHKRMSGLSDYEKTELLKELSEVAFADSECRVYLKFL